MLSRERFVAEHRRNRIELGEPLRLHQFARETLGDRFRCERVASVQMKSHRFAHEATLRRNARRVVTKFVTPA